MARLVTFSAPSAASRPVLHPRLEAVACNPALLKLAQAQCVMMLQGPVGPFFNRLSRWLLANGSSVHRVVFQPGDLHDCSVGERIAFRGDALQWPDFFHDVVTSRGVDTLVLFGQVRQHHAAAIERARAMGLNVIVLEEGYIRPGYITMELDGVNGFSTTLDRFRWQPDLAGPIVRTRKPDTTRHQFRQMALFACRHYWAMYWGKPVSPTYQHHKSTNIWSHSFYWVRSFLRKHLYLLRDGARVQRLTDQSYFFVPLQHDGDSQITHHSPYFQNTEFIIEVLRSFAEHAPRDALLVFRQHPHSRGGRSHERLIRSLATDLGVGERVVHLVEGHTPTIVAHSRGVVVINSTVGLQALVRNKPLKVLGHALYDRPGLSFEGPLERFWADCPEPDPERTQAFVQSVIALTQVPCNVYGRASEPLHWTPAHAPAGDASP